MTHPAIQEIVAVFGQPVAGNPTQYMMEKAFAQLGLDWRYLTLEVAPEVLGDAVRGMRAMGFRGCNLTIPHKVAVIQYLDRTSEAATLMGAVNCVNRVGTELVGDNTDGKGFVQSLNELTDPAGKNVVILGAGGAARAIAVEIALAGAATITVVNRGETRGQELVTLLNEKVKCRRSSCCWEGDYHVPPEAEVVINATSIGLGDAEARVPLAIGIAGVGHGRGRRDLQPARDAAAARGQGTRLPDARRPGHAGESSRDRLSYLDRPECRSAGDARSARRVSGNLAT